MQVPGGPLWELALAAPPGTADALDRWLTDWVASRRAAAGVFDARIVEPDGDAADERVRRRVLVFLPEDPPGADMPSADEIGAELPDDLREQVGIETRLLRATADDASSRPHCANCDAALYGQYCGTCGQRAQHRIISLWELLRDAAGDLFELDSRLWRTLIPLATKPGLLTADYLRGRRARYMPPFRMYLVLSLLFFVVESLDSSGLVVADGEPMPPGADTCAELNVEGLDDVTLLGLELTEERARQVCERIVGDGGQAFVRALFDNLAVALYVLLPLMAFVLKLLYPLSRRYYVEHLLFVVHVHAFFFLVLLAQLALDALVALPGGSVAALPATLLGFYALYYPYGGMRRVYGQGRLATVAKFLVLVVTYVVSFALMMAAAALVAAISL